MLPRIFQGGMGVNISNSRLANFVARLGALGTVSGVAADIVFARLLQKGDPGGDIHRALSHFPFPAMARLVYDEYFVSGGILPGASYKSVPAVTLEPSPMSIALMICANYAFVWLAKEGHDRPISINWLEKMQMPHLYSIYGAMLAGVDYVTMGAGIPLQIPGVLDAYASGQPAEYHVTVTGSGSGSVVMRFDPRQYFDESLPTLRRPGFLPIISSNGLARVMMHRLPPGSIQGFIIEGPTAGGHNAPPRDKHVLNDLGEPVYGPRDQIDFADLLDTLRGVPFWIGGSYASPAGLARALSLGANGIQVGSIFALCVESGMDPRLRQKIIDRWRSGELRIKKDALASPTGFPFQVVQLPGTLSDADVYQDRHRSCNLRCLSTPHLLPNGEVAYRCPAEPVRIYRQKEGAPEDTVEKRCICNGLMSTAGLGDRNPDEPPIVTLGDNLDFLEHLTTDENSAYTAAQAMQYLLSSV